MGKPARRRVVFFLLSTAFDPRFSQVACLFVKKIKRGIPIKMSKFKNSQYPLVAPNPKSVQITKNTAERFRTKAQENLG